MATDREKLLPNRAPPPPTYGSTPSAVLATQRQTLRAQDEALDHLSHGVAAVRNIAGMIHSEVAHQNRALDALDPHIDSANRDIEAARGKTRNLVASTYNFRTFCMLLWPLVLLIVLLVEAIVHFIF